MTFEDWCETLSTREQNQLPYDYLRNAFEAGQETVGTDGSVWLYCLASAAIDVGDVLSITSATSAATPITTTNASFGNQVGVAIVAIASGSYGWVQRAGYCETGINVAYACAHHVQLATTAVDGYVDDAVTTGTKNISGLIITATNTAATAAEAPFQKPRARSADSGGKKETEAP